MVTGFPEVRLTPNMGAVVLKELLQSLEGVWPPLHWVGGVAAVVALPVPFVDAGDDEI